LKTRTRIHIDRQRMTRGEPCIVVEANDQTQFLATVNIAGPSQVVFDPRGMPASGKRRPIHVWVETEAPVTEA
jgi:hypothetical protein